MQNKNINNLCSDISTLKKELEKLTIYDLVHKGEDFLNNLVDLYGLKTISELVEFMAKDAYLSLFNLPLDKHTEILLNDSRVGILPFLDDESKHLMDVTAYHRDLHLMMLGYECKALLLVKCIYDRKNKTLDLYEPVFDNTYFRDLKTTKELYAGLVSYAKTIADLSFIGFDNLDKKDFRSMAGHMNLTQFLKHNNHILGARCIIKLNKDDIKKLKNS